ncbi:hypothetical protein P4576_22475 [Peribacillus frigoritolerans]|uniref:hypothetical protein n=1 Tax=Peribacillus frigoritolerans TaxID=450367 RepID=UPI002E23F503|nr:hypothetical protein [Peribacillus frigoritolerans]
MTEEQNNKQELHEKKAKTYPYIPKFEFPIVEVVMEMAEKVEKQMKPIYTAMQNINTTSIAKAMSSLYKQIPEIITTLDYFESGVHETIDLLGKHGWVIHYDLPMDVLMNLMEEIEGMKQEDVQNYIDTLFIELYDTEYHDIKEFFLSYYEGDKGYSALTQQLFEAYERDHYLVMVSPLFQLLERTIYQIAEPFNEENSRFSSSHKAIKKLMQKVSEKEDNWQSATDLSALRFIKNYFESTKEWREREGNNRNWILHGFDDLTEIGKRDILQIITSISSLIHLSAYIEKEAERFKER